jgi:helix-turn-helix protein
VPKLPAVLVKKVLNNELDLLIPREVAALLRTTPGVLAVWRCKNSVALPYVKLGAKILYRRSDVEAFLASRTHDGKTGEAVKS